MNLKKHKFLAFVLLMALMGAAIIMLTPRLRVKALRFAFRNLGRENIAQYLDPVMEKFFPISEKFWLHRANAIKKLETAGRKYSGVEIDVNYYSDKDDFDASHDLQNSIKYPFSENLAFLGKNNQKIWIDYKNLNSENAVASLKKLEGLLSAAGVAKERCIIENKNFKDLKIFKESGFYTSYYVPVDERYLKTESGAEEFIAALREAEASGNVNAVSFPDIYYELVKRSGVKTDFLAWNSGSNKWYEYYIMGDLNAVYKDERVKVILVTEQSKFDR